jgi:tetratricopeptide (TPR) repeat protein
MSRRHLSIALLLLAIGGLLVHLARQAWAKSRFSAAEAALLDRDFPRARQLLDECLRVWPGDDQVLLLAAQAARRDGAPSDAERLLQAALRARAVPDAVELERLLLQLQSGDTRHLDHFLEVCQAHPAAAESRLILEAAIIGSLQRIDVALARKCLELWEKHCVRDPDRVQGWIWAGEIAIRTGDVDTAAGHFRQVVEAQPEHDKARLRLAELLSRSAPREALDHLDRLRSVSPDDRDVRLQRARCFRSLGEHEQAGELLTAVLSTAPGDYEILLELGEISLELRRLDAAEQWLRAAIEIQPNRRDPNLALARCLQLAGKQDEAQQYRDRVAEIDAMLEERLRLLREKGSLHP